MNLRKQRRIRKRTQKQTAETDARAPEEGHERYSITTSLEAALEAAEKERDDFKDRYLRTFSDFNNYKKRSLTAAATCKPRRAGRSDREDTAGAG